MNVDCDDYACVLQIFSKDKRSLLARDTANRTECAMIPSGMKAERRYFILTY